MKTPCGRLPAKASRFISLAIFLLCVTYAHLNAAAATEFRNDPTNHRDVSDPYVPVTYSPSADLSIVLSGSPRLGADGNVTYTVVIKNNGPDIAGDVVLQESFPPFSFRFPVPLSPGTTVNLNFTRFNTGPIGLPTTETLTIQSSVPDPDPSNNSIVVPLVVQSVEPKILSARIEGKKLFVSGSDFKDGSVVEIDGKSFKTVFKDGADSQTLTAKKGGKKIKPGRTVVITVVNPGGTRSAEFPFTRSGA